MSRTSIFLAFAGLIVAGCSSHPDGTNATGDAPEGGAEEGGSDDGGSAIDGGTTTDGGSALTLLTEPDQGMQPIYDFVGTATKTLDMTMYELVDTQFTTLLTKAASNGVTVRVILDQNDEKTDNTPAYNALSAGGVQVHWADPTYEATHQKTITVDGTTSAIMTLNLAAEDYPTSRDFAVITSDPTDVAAIESVFAADFAGTSITPGDDLVWSPTNSESQLLGVINGAKTSLLVENEEMSDSAIVSALAGAGSRGVDVRVTMEDSTSYQTEFTTLVNAGVKLATYEHAAIYIHAKVILADYGTSTAKVFIGSENFSNASLTSNRELGIITGDPGVMAGIEKTLTADFTGGTTFSD